MWENVSCNCSTFVGSNLSGIFERCTTQVLIRVLTGTRRKDRDGPGTESDGGRVTVTKISSDDSQEKDATAAEEA